MAQCNTVTFTAADGSKQAFPLQFLVEKGAVIASQVNGAPVTETFGAVNQLWIPGIPAKFFVRNIVAIDFTHEDEVPAIPSFEDNGRDYTNLPNVSVESMPVAIAGLPLELKGYAYDFGKAVTRVELSLDQGASWLACELGDADADQLVQWTYAWTPSRPGTYTAWARSVNEDGKTSPHNAVCGFNVL